RLAGGAPDADLVRDNAPAGAAGGPAGAAGAAALHGGQPAGPRTGRARRGPGRDAARHGFEIRALPAGCGRPDRAPRRPRPRPDAALAEGPGRPPQRSRRHPRRPGLRPLMAVEALGRRPRPAESLPRLRVLWLLVAAAVLATAIWGRLAYWQLARHEQLAQVARDQYTKVVPLPAARGGIYDSRMRPLVLNTEVYSVF